ncbi:MAG: YbjP/YqhG family protein [Zoogloeaceae bacterium]|nr:YbjP/YqhG family protein [Zoogloeaceae bacterium]
MWPGTFFLFLVSLTLCLFSPQTLARAPDAASARSFVEEVYFLFANAHGSLLPREQQKEDGFATPELRALMQKSWRLTPADMAPLLSEEPLCDCQDSDAPQVKSIEIGEIRENRTRAEVVLALWASLPDEIVTIELALLWRDGRWRIDDVFRPDLYGVGSDGGVQSTSLRARLQADIAESEFFLREGKETARKFIADIFAEYRDGARSDIWRVGENAIASHYFPERLKKLAALGGKPDFDPICNCRDYQDIRVLKIEVVLLAQKMARVTVLFTKDAIYELTQEFELMWCGKETGWRIYDIRGSLLPWLFREINNAPGKTPPQEAPARN